MSWDKNLASNPPLRYTLYKMYSMPVKLLINFLINSSLVLAVSETLKHIEFTYIVITYNLLKSFLLKKPAL